jgi:endonuclease YncB( thermonuclease family)
VCLLGVSAVVGLRPAAASDRDCTDFSSQAEAQRFFIDQGGPARDPHRLDGSDDDGVACGSLPCPCSRSGGSRPRRKRAKVIRARITSVVDGDTVRVRAYRAKRKRYAVRLIGGLSRHSVG